MFQIDIPMNIITTILKRSNVMESQSISCSNIILRLLDSRFSNNAPIFTTEVEDQFHYFIFHCQYYFIKLFNIIYFLHVWKILLLILCFSISINNLNIKKNVSPARQEIAFNMRQLLRIFWPNRILNEFLRWRWTIKNTSR